MDELMTILEYQKWMQQRLRDAIVEWCYCQVGVMVCLWIYIITKSSIHMKLAGCFSLVSIFIIIGRVEQIRRKKTDCSMLTVKEFYGSITLGIFSDLTSLFMRMHK